jgi:cytochrome P450
VTVDPYFDPHDPEHVRNPYGTYARLRAEAPVHHSPLGFWIISRYDDVMELLRDPRGSREMHRWSEAYERSHAAAGPDWERFVLDQVQFMDPPNHTRQRKLVSKAFTPMAIDANRPRVEQIVRELLGAADGSIDVVEELARPLPYRIISEMLGVPWDDPRLEPEWITMIVRGLSTMVTDDDMRDARDALTGITGLFHDVIEDHRRRPRADLMSALIEAEEEGDRLNTSELFALSINLLVGGSETTMNLVASALYSLLRFPSQLELLRRDPSRMRNAVEEFLRFESPAQFQSRTSTQPIEVRGVTIPPGQTIYLCLGSANHDDARWERPDELDIERRELQHMAFGYGIHHCLGASLARLETTVAVQALIGLPGLELVGPEPQWGGAAALSQRGLKHLHVRWRDAR